jgi:glycosyltransferase involved in cell wall biosynthesis
MPADRAYDVVVPTTGRRWDFLSAALESIEQQTVAPARILVVVDGNPEAAERLRARGGVVVLEHERPLGPAASRQTGIEAATSAWVAFLDDDDLWRAHKQERLFAYLDEHPACLALRAGYWMFAPAQGASGLFGQAPELLGTSLAELEAAVRLAEPGNDLDYLDIEGRSLELMLERNRGVIGTSMVDRRLLQSLPPVERGLAPGDEYLLFCHVAARTEWHLVRERLELYRLHPGQDSRNAGSAPALAILRAKGLAWGAYGRQSRTPLGSYGATFADEVRQYWWTVLKQTRSPRQALGVYRAGLPLLPRWRHRLAAAVPEPVVWRVREARRRPSADAGAEVARPSW